MRYALRMRAFVVGLFALLAACSGCAKSPPAITEVQGVLLLNGKPLPSALIEFQPAIEVGPEWISSGITDENGKFTLRMEQKDTAGAAICKHRIVVRDAPAPAGARGMSGEAQERMAKYTESLQNRPIPEIYRSAGKTTAEVEVKADQKEYKIELTR